MPNLRDLVAFLGLTILAAGLGILALWLGLSAFGVGLLYLSLYHMDGEHGPTGTDRATPGS